MIAVVTGGSGFIGQNLVRRLHAEGHEVRCLLRRGGAELPAGVQRFIVELDDPRSVLSTPALEGADVVFHLAGATKATAEAAFVAANVAPTRTLLGAITARREFPRFVLVSSQAAAGPASDVRHPIDEDDPPHPVEAYGRSKLQAERVALGFADHVPITIVRPCSVFGPFDRDFLTLFRLAQRGVLLFPAVRDHWLSLLHVDDVVDGLLVAATHQRAICGTFFLSSAEPLQWRSLGDAIAGATGRRVRQLNVPRLAMRVAALAGDGLSRITGRATIANHHKLALARQRYWVCSSARARRELGFSPTRSLPAAVSDTYYWYRTQGWVAGSGPAARPHA